MKLDVSLRDKVFEVLNHILELEMSGVIKYTHYSLMIVGYSRIPIVSWMRSQAQESLNHATEAGEIITHFEGHPILKVAHLEETHQHDIYAMLKESLEHEHKSLELYYKLLDLTVGKSVMLEDYARRLIVEEEKHIGEVEKMLMNIK